MVLGILVWSQSEDGLGNHIEKQKQTLRTSTATENRSGTDCRTPRGRTPVLPQGWVSGQDTDRKRHTRLPSVRQSVREDKGVQISGRLYGWGWDVKGSSQKERDRDANICLTL